MSRAVYEDALDSEVNKNRFGVKDLKRRPLAGRWNTPDLSGGDFSQPDPPLGEHQFRLHMDGALEFKGHLVPGTSGTVAYTLPGAITVEPDYRPGHDVSFLTDLAASPTTFTIARVYIDSVTGDVTIFFPVS